MSKLPQVGGTLGQTRPPCNSRELHSLSFKCLPMPLFEARSFSCHDRTPGDRRRLPTRKKPGRVNCRDEPGHDEVNVAYPATCPTPAAASAPRTTTSQGGTFHIISSRNAAMAMAKSAGAVMALVHTGV